MGSWVFVVNRAKESIKRALQASGLVLISAETQCSVLIVSETLCEHNFSVFWFWLLLDFSPARIVWQPCVHHFDGDHRVRLFSWEPPNDNDSFVIFCLVVLFSSVWLPAFSFHILSLLCVLSGSDVTPNDDGSWFYLHNSDDKEIQRGYKDSSCNHSWRARDF